MKKFVALLLAVMMVLASASVIAYAAGSPTPNKPTTSTTTEETEPEDTLKFSPDLGEVGKKTVDGMTENPDNPIIVFTDETIEKVTGIVGEKVAVHDVYSVTAPGWTSDMGAQVVRLQFSTEYLKGTPVSVILVTVKGEEITETVLPAEVVEDYIVEVTFDMDAMQKLTEADEAFIVVVSQAAEEAAAE